MSTIIHSLNRKQPVTFSRLLILAVGLFAAPWLLADDALPSKPKKQEGVKEAEESAEYQNEVTFSSTGAFTTGDRAQFMRRHGVAQDFSGGVKSLLIEQKVFKDSTFEVEGHALFDAHDYEIKLRLETPEIGHVEAGYEEFRTWYDGNGGFYPQNSRWFSLENNEMHVDRGEAWFEAELALTDLPVLTFRYTHEFRRGKKDSIEWGDSTLTDNFSSTKKITPSFWKYDETRDIFDGRLKHTIDKTNVKAGLKYELGDDKNAHYIRRNQNEATERYLTQREISSSDLFNFNTSTETWFTERLMMASAYSYTTMNTHVGGDLIIGNTYDSAFTRLYSNRRSNDGGYLDLNGGSQINQHVANLNLLTLPLEDFTLTGALRAEREGTDSRASQHDTTVAANNAAVAISQADESAASAWLRLAQQLEASYKGVRDWVLFARGEWEEQDGDLNENRWTGSERPATLITRDTHADVFRQKYTLGANWYPAKQVNVGAQYYHRIRSNAYTHRNDSTRNDYLTGGSGDSSPAWMNGLKLYTDDVDVRTTWRILDNLTSVTRYDFQLGTVEAGAGDGGAIQTAESISHTLGESLTWSPWSCLYFQGSANVTLDRTWTPANSAVSSVGSTAGSVVRTSENNFWNGSFTANYALNTRTDLQANYLYYRAFGNYEAEAVTVPYGADAEEHGVTLAMIHRISDCIRWSLKYGFFKNQDQLSGGHNDYDAHLVSTDIQVQF